MKTKIKRKKVYKIIGLSIAAVIVLAILICGSYIGFSFIKIKDINLKSESQITTDSIEFGADMSYLYSDFCLAKKTVRLGYNKNTSIKVVLNKNLREETKQAVINTFDNKINPIFEIINPKYNFEVVNKRDFKKTSADKVIIYIDRTEDFGFIVPDAELHYDLGMLITGIQTSPRIVINEAYDESIESLEYAVLHEFMHALGFGDVYDVNNYITMLKTSSPCAGLLKPNDIKAVAALYFDGTESPITVSEVKEWINLYIENFYNSFSELFVDTTVGIFEPLFVDEFGHGMYNLIEEVPILDIEPFDELDLKGTYTIGQVEYYFHFKDGYFQYSLKNLATLEILEERQGMYYHSGGILFLGAFELLIRNENTKLDLVIVKTEKGLILMGITEWLESPYGISENHKIYLSENK